MPLYDYDCAACGRRFEVVHGVHGDPPATCPLCGSGPVRKAVVAPAVHYKGSGWAKKERRIAPASKDKGASGETDSGSTSTDDGGTADAKSGRSTPASDGETSTPAASPTKSDD